MPYRYLEEVAIADVAFEAWAETRESLFKEAADATMNVMVADLGTISPRLSRPVQLNPEELDLLLFDYLQELIYFKDAEQLLLRSANLSLESVNSEFSLSGELAGETLDPERHDLIVDVKAVTLHEFRIWESERGWEAHVILDI